MASPPNEPSEPTTRRRLLAVDGNRGNQRRASAADVRGQIHQVGAGSPGNDANTVRHAEGRVDLDAWAPGPPGLNGELPDVPVIDRDLLRRADGQLDDVRHDHR